MSELERYFARGVVVKVAPELDLVEVAARVMDDDAAKAGQWMQSGRMTRASIEDVKCWVQSQPLFWAIVVAPWVLVQEVAGEN